jgi:hypothetical protein
MLAFLRALGYKMVCPDLFTETIGSTEKFAERLIRDINKQFLMKWEYQLDLLSQRRELVTGGTIATLVRTLNKYGNILLEYKDKFKATTMIIDYEE